LNAISKVSLVGRHGNGTDDDKPVAMTIYKAENIYQQHVA
jgi:hypothetical protein